MNTSLITGATAGIGAAFARRLASEGSGLVLVARDRARLSERAGELADRYGVEVETLAADLAEPSGRESVERRLADAERPIDLLVNNAGIGGTGTFWRRPVAEAERLLELNVRAVMRLTHAALGAMVSRGRGGIINVSSMSGFVPWNRTATYGPSKAWVTAFSEALAAELAGTGVRLSVVCPGYTHTEFHDRAGIDMSRLPGWMWLDADAVAEAALRDHRRGRAVSIPGGQYKAMAAAIKFGPRAIVREVARRT